MSGAVLKGRLAVVVGAGPSGVALTKFLVRRGANVTLVDNRPEEKVRPLLEEALDLSKFRLECGEYQQKTFEGAQLVVVTPGVPMDLKVLEFARTSGIEVVSELEFVSTQADEPFIAVAGTNGKSTTAALLTRMLEGAGKTVYANVDQPLADYLNKSKPADYVVAVANSFQLEGIRNFKPETVIFTNLAEDHLHRYPNLETYFAANREVFRNVGLETRVLLNAGDANTLAFAQQISGKLAFFGGSELPQNFDGAWANKNEMKVRVGTEVGQATEHSFELKNLRLRGPGNRENLMAASLLALQMGVKPVVVQGVIDSFSALPGRIEFVKRINSVAFYGDSHGANPAASLRTLQAFQEPLILISGGRDKNADYSALAPHVRQRVKNLILVGEAKEKINRALGDFTETFLVGTVEEAILIAYQKSRGGDVVLFSPMCEGTDQFAHHAERADYFRKLVLQLAQPRKLNYI